MSQRPSADHPWRRKNYKDPRWIRNPTEDLVLAREMDEEIVAEVPEHPGPLPPTHHKCAYLPCTEQIPVRRKWCVSHNTPHFR